MVCYKLVSVIDNVITINVAESRNGHTHYGHLKLEPNKIYTTDGDTILENSLRKYELKKVYTEQLENALKQAGVPYEVKMCRQCGGRKRNLFYNPVEVFEYGK